MKGRRTLVSMVLIAVVSYAGGRRWLASQGARQGGAHIPRTESARGPAVPRGADPTPETDAALEPQHPEDLGRVARELRHAGARDEAVRVLDEAILLASQAPGEKVAVLIDLYSARAFDAEAAGDLARAEQDYRRALELTEERDGWTSPEVFERMRALVELYRRSGQDVDAEVLLDELVRRHEGALRQADDPRDMRTLETNLARDLEVLGEEERAEVRHLEAVAEAERDPDASPLSLVASLRELERFYVERGRIFESRDALARIVSAREQDARAQPSELGRALLDLGERDLEIGERASGRASVERAAALYDSLSTDTRADRGIRLQGLRRAAAALDDWPAAARYYLDALANDADARSPEAIVAQLRRESVRWAEGGDVERSADTTALAAAVAEIVLGADHPETVELNEPGLPPARF